MMLIRGPTISSERTICGRPYVSVNNMTLELQFMHCAMMTLNSQRVIGLLSGIYVGSYDIRRTIRLVNYELYG